jgi:hypothetical protein
VGEAVEIFPPEPVAAAQGDVGHAGASLSGVGRHYIVARRWTSTSRPSNRPSGARCAPGSRPMSPPTCGGGASPPRAPTATRWRGCATGSARSTRRASWGWTGLRSTAAAARPSSSR